MNLGICSKKHLFRKVFHYLSSHLSRHSSFGLHEPTVDLVGACIHSSIDFSHTSIGDKPKAPGAFGVWVFHHLRKT